MTDTSFTYVRDEMLPQQKPPASQSGAILWIRENLFSSWLNTFPRWRQSMSST